MSPEQIEVPVIEFSALVKQWSRTPGWTSRTDWTSELMKMGRM